MASRILASFRRALLGPLPRYLVSGGIAFVVDYSILITLTEFLGIHYLWSATAGFTLGSLVCYLLSITWVFDERRYEERSKELGLFVLIGACGLVLNNILLWLLVGIVGIPYQFAKIIVAALVMFFNYFARLLLVFTRKPTAISG